MPAATLLLREPAATSLASLVEKSQLRKPPLPEFDLRLNACQLDFVLLSGPDPRGKPLADEGFESDVDTLSIVSSDDSFTSGPLQENKTQETDSANGSASSDSDTEAAPQQSLPKAEATSASSESHHLVDCMCYNDIKFPNILVFVVKGDALVFRFGNLEALKGFYASFSTFKAIANQKAYSKTFATKFNLLQRTDRNGITHIEITKEPEPRLSPPSKSEPSSIISLNTPETPHNSVQLSVHNKSRPSSKDASSRQRSESPSDGQSRKSSHGSKVASQRSASTENILGLQSRVSSRPEGAKVPEASLQKVWNSAEDLLDSPKRPERRRKPKPKAPPPPDNQGDSLDAKAKQDVLRGQYVRVNVTSADIKPPEGIHSRPFSTKDSLSRLQKMLPTRDLSLTLNSRPKEQSFQQFKYVEPKRVTSPSECRASSDNPWTYSVPRFLKKTRSHSETRSFTPMAYRYIDTTQSQSFYGGRVDSMASLQQHSSTSNVSNRLFGMSSKLKDFSSVSGSSTTKRYEQWENRKDIRRSSLGELTYKISSSGGSLKSVIKKDDSKRRNNEKKVTFSAYTTVQVV